MGWRNHGESAAGRCVRPSTGCLDTPEGHRRHPYPEQRFLLYDHVLDATAMVSALPEACGEKGGKFLPGHLFCYGAGNLSGGGECCELSGLNSSAALIHDIERTFQKIALRPLTTAVTISLLRPSYLFCSS